MSDFVYLDDDYGEFIKVDGLCYQKISADSVPPDFIGPPDEQGFKSCTDCAEGLVVSSSSSSSSSTEVADFSTSSTDDEVFPDFNGVDRYFQTDQANDLTLPSNMNWGFSFWLVRDNSSDASIISKFSSNAFTQEYSIRIISDKLNIFIYNSLNTESIDFTSVASIPIGELTHIVVTSDNNDVKIYIDGQFDSGVFHSLLPKQSVSDFTIAANSASTTSDFFDGTIFYVSKWDKTLSITNVNELYNDGLPYPCECYSSNLNIDFISCWYLNGNTLDSRDDNDLVNFGSTPFTRVHSVADCPAGSSQLLLESESSSSSSNSSSSSSSSSSSLSSASSIVLKSSSSSIIESNSSDSTIALTSSDSSESISSTSSGTEAESNSVDDCSATAETGFSPCCDGVQPACIIFPFNESPYDPVAENLGKQIVYQGNTYEMVIIYNPLDIPDNSVCNITCPVGAATILTKEDDWAFDFDGTNCSNVDCDNSSSSSQSSSSSNSTINMSTSSDSTLSSESTVGQSTSSDSTVGQSTSSESTVGQSTSSESSSSSSTIGQSTSSESSSTPGAPDNSSSSSGAAFALCGSSNSKPTVFMTVSWTDADVTKEFLGCTWTDGETKQVYSTSYKPGYFAPGSPHFQYNSYYQRWANNNGGDNLTLYALWNSTDFLGTMANCGAERNQLWINASMDPDFSSFKFTGKKERNENIQGNCTPYTSVIASVGVATAPNLNNFGLSSHQYLKDGMFQSITTSNGVTISWARGNGW